VVQPITIEESFPLAPEFPDPGLPAPPAPTTIVPILEPPVDMDEIFLKPPAPPPPAPPPLPTGPEPPPPPPPATTRASTNLVPGCVVIPGEFDVLTVCVFLPLDVTFIGPIIPPLPAII
jgi:hypothetical protein